MRRMRNVNLFQPRECRVFTEFGRYALGPLSSCFICASFLSLFSALALCVDLETASDECGKRTTEKHILAHWRREACAEMAQVAVSASRLAPQLHLPTFYMRRIASCSFTRPTAGLLRFNFHFAASSTLSTLLCVACAVAVTNAFAHMLFSITNAGR